MTEADRMYRITAYARALSALAECRAAVGPGQVAEKMEVTMLYLRDAMTAAVLDGGDR